MTRRSRRTDRGAAVVDAVLVLVVLVPLVLGITQVALVLHVRSTLAMAASEGARYAATADRDPADGERVAVEHVREATSGRYARDVLVRRTTVSGAPMIEVVVRAEVPALALGGPAFAFTVTGHAVEESR